MKRSQRAGRQYTWADRARRHATTEAGLRILWYSQDYKCAICGSYTDEIHVDHDHRSGRIRGILCRRCNIMLGHARDDTAILQSAIEYLDRKLDPALETLLQKRDPADSTAPVSATAEAA